MTASDAAIAIKVLAALGNHDLTGFESIEDDTGIIRGYQAKCRKCRQTAWFNDAGLQYSVLDDNCRGVNDARRKQ